MKLQLRGGTVAAGTAMGGCNVRVLKRKNREVDNM